MRRHHHQQLNRFARAVALALVFAVAIAGAACIQKDVQSVLYLELEGSATWTIFEGNVHSDAEDPTDRVREEGEYRRQVLANPTPLVMLLESLGGRRASRTVLKDTAPFEVHSSADFDRVDALFYRVCAAASRYCIVSLSDEGGRRVLTVEDVEEMPASDHEKDALLDEVVANLRIVLVEGRFVEAKGFRLTDDRTAVLVDGSEGDESAPMKLRLVWEAGRQ